MCLPRSGFLGYQSALAVNVYFVSSVFAPTTIGGSCSADPPIVNVGSPYKIYVRFNASLACLLLSSSDCRVFHFPSPSLPVCISPQSILFTHSLVVFLSLGATPETSSSALFVVTFLSVVISNTFGDVSMFNCSSQSVLFCDFFSRVWPTSASVDRRSSQLAVGLLHALPTLATT